MQTFHSGEIRLFAAQGISEIEDAFHLWLESMQARGLSPKSLTGYASEVGQFVRFLRKQLNLTDLDAVQPHHIRKWLIYRQQHGISNAQLHNDYRKPRTFWNWCVRENLATHNPFASVEKPKLQPTLKPALTPDEVEQILQACDGKDWLRLRDKALILLLLDTGLRIHEAHKLTVADAQCETVLIRGKGGKQRVVFLSHEVRLAIRRYLNACPFAPTGDAPLWWGKYGALTLHGLLEVIQKIGKRAGLPKHLGAHAFRRTFATWSLRSGIDLEHLRQLMGHSDYTVLRQYLSLVETDLKRAHQQHSPLRNLRGR
jgi:site-specific recombinase XerD